MLIVKGFVSGFVNQIQTDAIGNMIATKKGEDPGLHTKIMVAGHMDKVGLMVTKIEEGGS